MALLIGPGMVGSKDPRCVYPWAGAKLSRCSPAGEDADKRDTSSRTSSGGPTHTKETGVEGMI